MSSPRERGVIVVGDASFCLIGAAAGASYFIFREDCGELARLISSEDYGVYIVLREVISKCRGVLSELLNKDALVVVVDSPKAMKEVDPKKYYEDLIAKYVGIRVSL